MRTVTTVRNLTHFILLTFSTFLTFLQLIHTSLSPNTERDDLWLALKSLFFPWNWFRWRKGGETKKLAQQLAKHLGVQHAISFQRGRDALYILLKSLGISFEDEVILQAYTCLVVPNAIQYTGAKPIYADIEAEGFNIDPKSIEQHITERTKAIIIQHTFGEPADIEAIQKICDKHKLILIEDCAHALSGSYKEKPLGTFGKAAIWSFGRDKIISSTWGGMITTDDTELAQTIVQHHEKLPLPSRCHTAQALAHPIVLALIKPFYASKVGKGLLVLAQKLKFIPRVIFATEKRGRKPSFFPEKMSNVLAKLALHQLKKLTRFQRQRQNLASLYTNSLQDIPQLTLPKTGKHSHPAWLRYTIRSPEADELLRKARRKGIYLGDWYRSVLAPGGSKLENFQYKKGSCPRAEKAAEETLNLPTHIQMTAEQVKEVVVLLRSLLDEKA